MKSNILKILIAASLAAGSAGANTNNMAYEDLVAKAIIKLDRKDAAFANAIEELRDEVAMLKNRKKQKQDAFSGKNSEEIEMLREFVNEE